MRRSLAAPRLLHRPLEANVARRVRSCSVAPLGGETGDLDVTQTITYVGGAAQASALVQMLEERGVRVEWRRPEEQRGFGADVEAMALSLMARARMTGSRPRWRSSGRGPRARRSPLRGRKRRNGSLVRGPPRTVMIPVKRRSVRQPYFVTWRGGFGCRQRGDVPDQRGCGVLITV